MSSLVAWILRVVCGARCNWLGASPELHQRIYFANHGSHLDAAMIWSVLPSPLRVQTHPVAARDYWERGRVRRWLAGRVFCVLLIERHKVTRDNNPITTMGNALGNGKSLILFPEGTRSDQATPKPFKSGLYHLAKRFPEVELVPVYLENLNRILPKGEILPVPMLGNMTIGTPIRIESGEHRDQFLARAHKAVCELQAT